MIKPITIFLFLSVFSLAQGQIYNYRDENYQENYESIKEKERSMREELGIKQIDFYKKKTNTKKEHLPFLFLTQKFNKNGKEYEFIYYSSKDKEKAKILYTYDEEGRLIDYNEINQKGRSTYRDINAYDSAGNKTLHIHYKKEGKIKYMWRSEYDSSGNLIKYSNYNRRNGKILDYWEYDYHPNGKRKETRHYDNKEKLRNLYKFTCEADDDEALEKNKKNICVELEKDSMGNTIEIIRKSDHKKRVYIEKRHYNAANLMCEADLFNHRDKIRATHSYEYDSAANIIYYSYIKYRPWIRVIMIKTAKYNKKNQLIEEGIYFCNKKRPYKHTRYFYMDNGMIKMKLSAFKSNTYQWGYNYEYKYYE